MLLTFGLMFQIKSCFAKSKAFPIVSRKSISMAIHLVTSFSQYI